MPADQSGTVQLWVADLRWRRLHTIPLVRWAYGAVWSSVRNRMEVTVMGANDVFLSSTRGDALTRAVRRVEVEESEASAALPGWDYADAFARSWPLDEPGGAMTVARALLGPSRSARRVLAGRDLLVRPFGLRVAHQGTALLFPVLLEEPDRVVCGFDDRHLDFRVIVTVSSGTAGCTTVVRRHGAVGTAYFAVVGPFHRWLVPHLMRRARAGQCVDEVRAS